MGSVSGGGGVTGFLLIRLHGVHTLGQREAHGYSGNDPSLTHDAPGVSLMRMPNERVP